jgi:hypothetical protein
MSFNRFCGVVLCVSIVSLFPFFSANAEPSAQAQISGDSLVKVVRDLSFGDEKKAKADIRKIPLPEVKGFSLQRLKQYDLLEGYLNPPESLSDSKIRKVLRHVGRNEDLVFWRAYQGQMG